MLKLKPYVLENRGRFGTITISPEIAEDIYREVRDFHALEDMQEAFANYTKFTGEYAFLNAWTADERFEYFETLIETYAGWKFDIIQDYVCNYMFNAHDNCLADSENVPEMMQEYLKYTDFGKKKEEE